MSEGGRKRKGEQRESSRVVEGRMEEERERKSKGRGALLGQKA